MEMGCMILMEFGLTVTATMSLIGARSSSRRRWIAMATSCWMPVNSSCEAPIAMATACWTCANRSFNFQTFQATLPKVDGLTTAMSMEFRTACRSVETST